MRSLISIDFPAPKMKPESAHVVSAVSVHWLQCRRKSKPISPKVYAQLLNTKTKTQGSRSVKNQWPHSV